MIRITAGRFRGRALATPKSQRTRPTVAKLRQALFNSIQADLPDARVLDLFAGSGALGFEALSRGAASAVFVDFSTEAIACIQRNARDLGVEAETRCVPDAFPRALSRVEKLVPPAFDLILADPPYRQGWEEKLIAELSASSLLALGGKLFIEWAFEKGKELPARAGFLVKVREKSYGDTVLTTYVRAENEEEIDTEDGSGGARDPGDLSGLV